MAIFVRYGLVHQCGHCGSPDTFDICQQLGYNPGVDGHLKETREAAQSDWDCYKEEVAKKSGKNSVLYEIAISGSIAKITFEIDNPITPDPSL